MTAPSTSSKIQMSVRSLMLDVSARVKSLAEIRKLTGIEPSEICASWSMHEVNETAISRVVKMDCFIMFLI